MSNIRQRQASSGGGVAARAGFWFGCAIFAVTLLLPPPQSMHDAARESLGEAETLRLTRSLLSDRGQQFTAADSEESQAAAAEVIAARARQMMRAAAVTLLVACWWITVALPIPVTSLLPLVLFPVFGVMPIGQAAGPYANPNVFLFMGGFIIALAIEKWGLHRRIALTVVLWVGVSRTTIVLGFMIATALLSMWISNTATAMMMLPIAAAVIAAVAGFESAPSDGSSSVAAPAPEAVCSSNFGAALMLGIAYAASIGGIGTPIGTPPNIAFYGQYHVLNPEAAPISFGKWVITFLPLVAVFIPITWWVLTRITCPVGKGRAEVGRDAIRAELEKLGPLRGPERRVLIVFVATAMLWMLRSVPVGEADYGWAALLDRALNAGPEVLNAFRAKWIDDATVAVGMAVLLFMIPAGTRSSEQARAASRLMDWETAQRLPWGILLLFGGGFAIAAGFQASGLSHWCGRAFVGLGITNPILLVLGVCLLMTFLTEITSNTATTQVMLPIVAKVSTAMHVDPLLLMLPATVSASCAFMLPVATPPNAIVFGSGYVEMGRMVKTGLMLNLIGALIVTGVTIWIAGPMMGFSAW